MIFVRHAIGRRGLDGRVSTVSLLELANVRTAVSQRLDRVYPTML